METKEAYTTRELVMLWGVSQQAIDKRARRESWQSRPRAGRGGGNEWLVASMPESTRLTIAARVCAKAPAPVSPERQSALAELVRLKGRAKVRAEARVAALTQCRLFTVNAGLPYTRGLEAFTARYNAGEIAVEPWVREALPSVCRNSLRNWDAAAQKGVSQLAGKYGVHRKLTGAIDSQPDVYDFVRAMLLEYPHVGARQILEGMKARFTKRPEIRLPSLRRLQAWLAEWKRAHAQVYMALVSPDAWRNKFRSSCGDAGELIVRPNQRWEFDGTPSDLLLSDGKRHTILGVIDVYTRRVKLHVSRTGTAAAVASLLRRALLDWGIPEEAVTDNGAEYIAAHTQLVLNGLGVYQNILPPFRPDLKPFIERVFHTFSHDHLELLQGYVGHSVTERKQIEDRKSFARRLMEKGAEVELNLSPEDLQRYCDDWTDTMYGNRPHGGLKGKTPNQMISEWTEPLRALPESGERALDVLLLPLADGEDGWRTVTKKGVAANGGTYDAAALGGMEGQRVQVRMDEAELGIVYLFDEAGEFVCRAVDHDLLGISRQEVATARRRKQQAEVAAQKKELRENSRKVGVKDIAREIRNEALRQATLNPARRPEMIPYTTPDLEQHGLAARAGTVPLSLAHNDAIAAAREAVRARLAVPADNWLPASPKARYQLCRSILETVEHGGDIPADRAEWARNYAASNEYAGFAMLYAMPRAVNE